ncbi:hypothetical protein JCM10908_004380 [Rhodotorula pacifica]|uniref:uncharacterized protein n=1 Tax=Rhodotorula pacifica TaxID=1495444 RepID=UPI00316EE77D
MTTDLDSLLSLGIPRPRAAFALKEHGGDVEAAADWCFTEGADWTPQSLLNTTPIPAPSARRSPSPPGSRIRSERGGSSVLQGDHPPGWKPVPHRLLVPGTRVSITLKQDQGTGRTVEGTVSERLTKGDHPRGVKVRLQDGRVGRVVSILH